MRRTCFRWRVDAADDDDDGICTAADSCMVVVEFQSLADIYDIDILLSVYVDNLLGKRT